jgi:hypothetical protein
MDRRNTSLSIRDTKYMLDREEKFLKKVGVEIITLDPFQKNMFQCKKCGAKWHVLDQKKIGPYWLCPKGCNKKGLPRNYVHSLMMHG